MRTKLMQNQCLYDHTNKKNDFFVEVVFVSTLILQPFLLTICATSDQSYE